MENIVKCFTFPPLWIAMFIYQKLFYKIFCLGKEFLWEFIFQFDYLLKYEIFISAKKKSVALM